jgi:hypothetical protein
VPAGERDFQRVRLLRVNAFSISRNQNTDLAIAVLRSQSLQQHQRRERHRLVVITLPRLAEEIPEIVELDLNPVIRHAGWAGLPHRGCAHQSWPSNPAAARWLMSLGRRLDIYVGSGSVESDGAEIFNVFLRRDPQPPDGPRHLAAPGPIADRRLGRLIVGGA